MGNCLKTKLKQQVTNSNLVALGHFRVKGLSGASIKLRGEEEIIFKSINNASINITQPARTSSTISISEGTIVDISNRYSHYFDITASGLEFDIASLKYSRIESIYINYGAYGNIAELANLPVFKKFFLRNNANVYGDISSLQGKFDINAGETTSIQSCSEVYGDCSFFASETGVGSTLNIYGTKCTISQSAINTLTANGVNVVYDTSQVVN